MKVDFHLCLLTPTYVARRRQTGGNQLGEGTACMSRVDAESSEVFVLQEVGSLEHFDVALVDFEGGAQAD